MDKKDLLRREKAERKKRYAAHRDALAEMDSAAIQTLRINLNSEAGLLRAQLADLTVHLGFITAELKRRNQPGPSVDVSEHAIVQYMERIMGIDTKAVRAKIRDAIPSDAKRGTKFTLDGIVYVIAENGRVTTTYKEESDG